MRHVEMCLRGTLLMVLMEMSLKYITRISVLGEDYLVIMSLICLCLFERTEDIK